jgi:hypothetical protein
MRLFIGAVFTASLSLFACGGGGGSGLDSDKRLSELTEAELLDLCEYIIDEGPSEPVECDDGVTYTPQTAAECAEDAFPESCTATVANAEACAEAIGEDVCTAFEDSRCAWIFECIGE